MNRNGITQEGATILANAVAKLNNLKILSIDLSK